MENKKKHIIISVTTAVLFIVIVVGAFWIFTHNGVSIIGGILSGKKQVAEIVISPGSIELKAGKTHMLSCKISPEDATDKTVTWYSSNVAVADVDADGQISAISEGEAVISAISSNGKVGECRVTVTPSAFQYLKKLSGGATCTIERDASSTNTDTIEFFYEYNTDTICLVRTSEWLLSTYTASVIIRSDISGEYAGVLTVDSALGGSDRSTYIVDATSFKTNSHINTLTTSAGPSDASEYEKMYSLDLCLMLYALNEKVLAPNGYTYADIGFNAFPNLNT